jgi:hypothetical protein
MVFFAVLALLSGFTYSKYLNLALLLNAYPPDDDHRWEEVVAGPRVTTTQQHKNATTNKVMHTHVGNSVSTTKATAGLTVSNNQKKPSDHQTQTGLIEQHQKHHDDDHQQYENTTFSFCLLIKDDNEILNEWIAYHYHTINLRHLIVAVDPLSSTSPSSIFEEWRQVFRLQVTEWTDQDYMPKFFLQNKYHRIRDFLQLKQNPNTNMWTEGITNQTVIEQTLQTINNHRFRQVVFLKKCVVSIRKRHEEQTRSNNNSNSTSSSSSTLSPLPLPKTTMTTTTPPSPPRPPRHGWHTLIPTNSLL